jgi:putative transposase
MKHTGSLRTHIPAPNDKGYRFPPEMISPGVWLSFRFSLSSRDMEERMAEPGITWTDETVREWCLKFGQTSAKEQRCLRPHGGDTWHLDEVFLTINGKQHSLRRAVDQHGTVLDIVVQSRGDKKAC